MDKSLVTADELAELLNIQKRAVYDLARNGAIAHYRIGKKLRFRPEEVLATFKVERCPLLVPSQDSSDN